MASRAACRPSARSARRRREASARPKAQAHPKEQSRAHKASTSTGTSTSRSSRQYLRAHVLHGEVVRGVRVFGARVDGLRALEQCAQDAGVSAGGGRVEAELAGLVGHRERHAAPEERERRLRMAVHRGHVQQRAPVRSPRQHVRAVLVHQLLHRARVPALRRHMQRIPVVLRVGHISTSHINTFEYQYNAQLLVPQVASGSQLEKRVTRKRKQVTHNVQQVSVRFPDE